jgi:hypothetical protein
VRSLNDQVEDIHVALWDNEEYRDLLDAVDNTEAVEGSLIADTFAAASMIRDYARANKVAAVMQAKLAAVVWSLKVVMRRYSMSRRERSAKADDGMLPDGNAAD